MRNGRHAKGNDYFLFGAIVLAFMGLSLAITATGTARFAVAMGYRAEVGYAVGIVFDLAKAVLPIAFATEATVSTAIAAIERNGS